MDEGEMPAEPVEGRQEPGVRQGQETSSEWLADRFEEQRFAIGGLPDARLPE